MHAAGPVGSWRVTADVRGAYPADAIIRSVDPRALEW